MATDYKKLVSAFTIADGCLDDDFLYYEPSLDNGTLPEIEFVRLGGGSGRVAYGIDKLPFADVIVKCPLNDSGELQSRVELKVYRAEPSLPLCPLLYDQNEILVQPRVMPLASGEEGRIPIFDWMRSHYYPQNQIEYVASVIEHLACTYQLMRSDLKKVASWGLLNGQLVLVDYGCNHEIYDRFYRDYNIKNGNPVEY